MQVKAAPGLRVPREDDPRKFIDDGEPVELEMTGYYIRRMSDGDLVEASEKTAATVSPAQLAEPQDSPKADDPKAGAKPANARKG